MRLSELLGLEGGGGRFETRGWLFFSLIVFGLFTPLEAIIAISNAVRGDWWPFLGYGLATCLFSYLLVFTINKWRELPR